MPSTHKQRQSETHFIDVFSEKASSEAILVLCRVKTQLFEILFTAHISV